jgi:hypothetical protein
LLSAKPTDIEKVAEILELGAGRIGQVYGQAVLPLLGVSDSAWGEKVLIRRTLAYEAFCAAELTPLASKKRKPITLATFQTRVENAILRNLASELVTLAAEHQLKAKRG